MLRASGILQVQCEKCGKVYDLHPELECIDSFERNMGMEYEMEYCYEGTCEQCGADQYVRLEVWEYPEFCVNTKKYETENVRVVQEAEIEPYD